MTGLEKYTDFLVSVAAGTSLGYGPFSLPVVIKTLEDSKLHNMITSYRTNYMWSLELQFLESQWIYR